MRKLGAGEQPRALRGGRSNHVWYLGEGNGQVLKLYNMQSENPMFANAPDRETASLANLAGTGIAPRLHDSGVFDGRRWVLYAHVKGTVWQQDTAHVAQLLGRLHDQPVPQVLPEGPDGSGAIAQRAESILAKCNAAGAGRIRAFRPDDPVEPSEMRAFIHGDPVPGNLIEHDGTLTLIDWQCPVAGDPAEDLAIFASPAMQLLYRGTVLTTAEEEAFLAAYPDPNIVARLRRLRPWYRWCMAAYCLWKTEQGQVEYQQAMELELQALTAQSSRDRTA